MIRSWYAISLTVAVVGSSNPGFAEPDAYAIAAYVTRNVDYEHTDNEVRDKIPIMKFRRLSLQFGPTIARLEQLMNRRGIETRIVRVLTAEPLNQGDDGFVMLEAFINDARRLFDPTLDRYPLKSGRHIGLRELIDSGAGRRVYTGDQGNSNDELSRWNARVLSTREQQAVWTTRIFQIPDCQDAASTTTFVLKHKHENRADWTTGLNPTFKVVRDNRLNG